ncbi:hypothetical protein SCALM49S_00872 [Streptomyces californicus]
MRTPGSRTYVPASRGGARRSVRVPHAGPRAGGPGRTGALPRARGRGTPVPPRGGHAGPRADRRAAGGPACGGPRRGNGSPLGVPGTHLRSGAVSPVRRVTGSTVPSLFPVSVPTRGGAARKQPRVAPPGRVTYCRCVVGPHPGVCDRSAGDSSPVTPYAAGAGDARDRPHRNVLGRRPAPSSAVSSPARTGQECRPVRRRAAATSARPAVSATAAAPATVSAPDPVEARPPPCPEPVPESEPPDAPAAPPPGAEVAGAPDGLASGPGSEVGGVDGPPSPSSAPR